MSDDDDEEDDSGDNSKDDDDEAVSIASYLSLAKTELSVRYGFELVTSSEKRLQRIVKQLKAPEPMSERRKRRGLRGRHLRRAFDKMRYRGANSRKSVNEWAALVTAWEALGRGGEMCYGQFKANKPGPTRADVTFEQDRHGPTATLWLRPLKKRGKAAAAKVPIVFAKYDGGGSDTYAALQRLVHFDPVPGREKRTTPLFRNGSGKGMTRDSFGKLVKRVAKALGFDPKHFGAHSPRIGGATDIGDTSPLLLQAKGRWSSDVAKIYARLTRRGLVRASRAMQKGGARDMEEIYATFAQPA